MASFQKLKIAVQRSCGTLVLAAGCAVFCAAPAALAQTLEQSAGYVSQVDQDLTIRKVAILPVTDNLEGIYARPIESHLTALVKSHHQWDFVETNIAGAIVGATELEESPDEVRKLGANIDADAFLAAKAVKGPNGLSIKLNLFLKNDGKLLVQEVLKDHPRFEISGLKEQVQGLYERMVAKIPYAGMIMSRQQNRVTLNIGKSDGITKDQVVTVVQIIKANRHPKFSFLISTEKEILGKVKVLKVDETLSFGAIISEKEKGAIKRLSKISGLDYVSYPEPEDLGTSKNELADRPDSDISFGKNPKEWVPVRPPSFGQAGLKVGLGSYNSGINLDGVGSLQAKTSFYPRLSLFGELWLNPNWLIRADIEQGMATTNNPRGGTPSELNHSISRYSVLAGYNILLRDDFFGPKLQIRTGFMTYRAFVDDSQPRSLSTTNYSGFLVGLSGMLPLSDDKKWFFGAALNLILFPKLDESPETSGGSPKNSINDFSFFVEKKLTENIRAIGSLDFSLYSTSFSGAGTRSEVATSMSQRSTTLNGGIAYLF